MCFQCFPFFSRSPAPDSTPLLQQQQSEHHGSNAQTPIYAPPPPQLIEDSAQIPPQPPSLLSNEQIGEQEVEEQTEVPSTEEPFPSEAEGYEHLGASFDVAKHQEESDSSSSSDVPLSSQHDTPLPSNGSSTHFEDLSSASQNEQKNRHRHRISQHLRDLRQQMKEEGGRLQNFYSGAKQQISDIRTVLSHSQEGQ